MSLKIESIILDREDTPILKQYPRWYISRKRSKTYIQNNKGEYLHRLIMNAPKGMVVDHINGDTLDNRRSNLRLCTHAQNISHRTKLNKNNTSGYAGVYWSKQTNKWVVRVRCQYEYIRLGHFLSKKDAAWVYNQAASQLFGEFAYQNKV